MCRQEELGDYCKSTTISWELPFSMRRIQRNLLCCRSSFRLLSLNRNPRSSGKRTISLELCSERSFLRWKSTRVIASQNQAWISWRVCHRLLLPFRIRVQARRMICRLRDLMGISICRYRCWITCCLLHQLREILRNYLRRYLRQWWMRLHCSLHQARQVSLRFSAGNSNSALMPNMVEWETVNWFEEVQSS